MSGATQAMRAALGPRVRNAISRSVVASVGRRAASSTVDSHFNPTEEHAQLREMVRSFTTNEVEPQAIEYNRDERFNIDLYRKLGDIGLLGVTVDPDYGGSGMDATAAVIAHEELSASDPAFCLSYLAHSMLFVNNLNLNGNEEQKQRYLPRACSGEIIGGMCMSEPGAGTDVLGLKTTAKKEGGSWKINGQKMWITNGAINDTETGDAFLVYARTGEGRNDITLFLVDKDTPGFSLGQRIKDKLGMRASGTAELVFDNATVPDENRVGELNGAVLCMMRNLEIERITLAAMSLGIARRSIEDMNKYANERKQFGKSINSFGQMQSYIARSYAEFMAGRSYTYLASNSLDLASSGNAIDSDGVKLFCSTMAKDIADRAIQVLGGNGYCGEYNVERLWRDAKLIEIGGGDRKSVV